MIERDAKPIGNRNPYKRVDLCRRKPRTIPAAEAEKYSAAELHEYWRDPLGNWHLHEDQ